MRCARASCNRTSVSPLPSIVASSEMPPPRSKGEEEEEKAVEARDDGDNDGAAVGV